MFISMHHFIFVLLCVLIDFCNVGLCLSLYGDEFVLYLGEYFFLLDDPAFEFAYEFSNSLILCLIDYVHWLEKVRMMLSEHLTLAAGRLTAVLTEIIKAYSMFPTFLNLFTALENEGNYVGQLIDKATAMSELPFYPFAAIGAFRFEFQTGSYAKFTVNFRAMRAKCWMARLAITDLASEQLFKLLLCLLQLTWVFLRGGTFNHSYYSI